MRRKGFFLVYSLRDTVHQGGEVVMLREWGGWSHCPCSQEAEGRLAVASLPNTKTLLPSVSQFFQRGTTSQRFHSLPKHSLARDHTLNHRSLGDISIWTTPHLSAIYLLALGTDASSAGRNCFRESVSEKKIRNRTFSHPVCTIDRPPHLYPLLLFFNVYLYPKSSHRKQFHLLLVI